MKKKIGILLVAILTLCAGIFFWHLVAMSKEEVIDVNKILENPDEYNNPISLNSLSDKQKFQVIISFNDLLYENCKDGKLNEKCTTYFLYSYMNVMLNLQQAYNTHSTDILNSTYLDFKSKYDLLTEDDFKGFAVPLLTQFCRAGVILDETERIYWVQKVIDVNKTIWQSTDMQIFYLKSCMRVLNITQLSEKTGIKLEELNSKICNMVSTLRDVNTKDLCCVVDYLSMKRFCGVNITTEDRVLVEDLISKKYESYHQNDCMNALSKLYNSIK